MRNVPMSELRSFLVRRKVKQSSDFVFRTRALRGGLESAVFDVRATLPAGSAAPLRFVVKVLEREHVREARVYEELVPRSPNRIAPELLDVHWRDGTTCLLFLERIRPARPWPWRDPSHTSNLLVRLARFHDLSGEHHGNGVVGDWDYESCLERSATATLALLENVRTHPVASPLRAGLPALRRVVQALPRLRRELLEFGLLGRTVLHGDVHSGNALVAREGALERPVLLDWGRARVGSPLEDVSSWLQSLGFWEPAAKRLHDTLLKSYLGARGLPRRLHRELRDAYWIAGASNALSGALRYHVSRAFQAERPNDDAIGAATDLLRIVRRADACAA